MCPLVYDEGWVDGVSQPSSTGVQRTLMCVDTQLSTNPVDCFHNKLLIFFLLP
jgi:hypothetical protein